MAKSKKSKTSKTTKKRSKKNAEEEYPVRPDLLYMNSLIAVAVVAGELVEAAEKLDRYYFRVSRRRLNTLKYGLEISGKIGNITNRE